MRIFSYLRYHRFRPGDLKAAGLHQLIDLAEPYDISIRDRERTGLQHRHVAELADFFNPKAAAPVEEALVEDVADGETMVKEVAAEVEEEVLDPREKDREVVIYLRPLVDIGNGWSMGEPPSDDDIASLAPIVTSIHLKDRDLAAGRTVPLGDGNVPWPAELKRLLGGVEAREVVASIETHCPQDGRNATARSVAALSRIAAEIGVEIV